nr:integrase, catalytic region, zinc finger, CCHC-type, peptidase aspartic, catalytic [Tanacetum cinerariifolium]
MYILSLGDMMASSPICLLSKASKTKSWLWHRRLSHLNFDALNHLARHGLVRGILKLKFEKDHLCSACAMGKSKKKPYKPKFEDTNQEKLYLLHMDLCGPMRVASISGNKYILVIVNDHSQFTWVKCLRLKDEALDFIIKFLKMIQLSLRRIIETIPVDFDELTAMASEHSSLELALHEMTPVTISSGLVSNPPPSTPYVPPSRTDWDIFFNQFEPKTYKDALTQACWIEAMQEEVNKFERLEVWELVPHPDKVMFITLKWIYKVKLDDLRGIMKNKARLVACGYRQEEGINFKESFTLVARLDAIRSFPVFAARMNMIVY